MEVAEIHTTIKNVIGKEKAHKETGGETEVGKSKRVEKEGQRER